MHAMIYLDGETGGRWMGHALAEVGCMWRAESQAEAEALASSAIREFYEWLRRHGEPGVEVPATLTIEVAAVTEIPNYNHSGAAVGTWETDYMPVTDTDIATAVRRLGYARRDLLELTAGLLPEVLDWAPPGEKRTIRRNLRHVRNCHGWYLTRVLGYDRVAEILPEPWPEEDSFFCLSWVMERAVNALLDLPQELRSGVYHAPQPAEPWTARKMLRRFVEHEREHVEVVRHTLALYQNR